MYVFNRYGQHLSTIDLLTGIQLYNFTYNVHSYFGRLLKVTDAGGQQMTIRRDYKLVARDIWVCFTEVSFNNGCVFLFQTRLI